MGKASELEDFLRRHPLSPEEVEARRGPRPDLRLDGAVKQNALDANADIDDVTGRLATGAKVVALHDAASRVAAVAIPVEQYLELVTSHIRDCELAEVKLNGQVAPSDETFSALGVEQVDPRATWLHIGGYDPSGPR